MVCPGLRLRFVAPTRQIVQSPTAMPRSTAHDTIAYRLTEILLRLNAGQALDPQQLADEFNVHPRTIRRDLNERFGFIGLEKKGDSYILPRTRLGTFSLQDVQRFASLAGLQGMAPRRRCLPALLACWLCYWVALVYTSFISALGAGALFIC